MSHRGEDSFGRWRVCRFYLVQMAVEWYMACSLKIVHQCFCCFVLFTQERCFTVPIQATPSSSFPSIQPLLFTIVFQYLPNSFLIALFIKLGFSTTSSFSLCVCLFISRNVGMAWHSLDHYFDVVDLLYITDGYSSICALSLMLLSIVWLRASRADFETAKMTMPVIFFSPHIELLMDNLNCCFND